MRIKNIVLGLGLLSTVVGMPGAFAQSKASEKQTVSSVQKVEIEKVVHDYLLNNPEILVEVSEKLQKKQQMAMENQAKSAIESNAKQLFQDGLAIAGNPKGNVTLVEFFDYQCIHCKKLEPVIAGLIKNNPNLRVIYKEFPIFGQGSVFASKAALAAAKQGKYSEMQTALLESSKRLDKTVVMDIAKAKGLDMTKLEADMNSKVIGDALNANRALAEKLHLMGTPAVIIAKIPAGQDAIQGEASFIPGSASEQALQDLINKAEGKK